MTATSSWEAAFARFGVQQPDLNDPGDRAAFLTLLEAEVEDRVVARLTSTVNAATARLAAQLEEVTP